jgi:GH15 family glucan-1,4-alpha-glucosidase
LDGVHRQGGASPPHSGCAPAEGFQVAAETRAFLAAQGVDLSGEQQTKTKTALDNFPEPDRGGHVVTAGQDGSPGGKPMDRYPPIAEHGLIGDLQTAALVTTDGSVDWFCCPRFDSPSVFGSLLDRDRGGFFRIAAEGDDVVVRQLYFPDTAILVTRFMTPGGVGEVIDFMPVEDPQQASDRHRLVRVVRCVRGQLRFVFECAPRFDYGRQEHQLELTDEGAVFSTPTLQLTLHGGGAGAMQRHGNDVRGALTVRAGQTGGVMLESAADGPPRTMTPEELLEMFTETAQFWRGWLARSSYRGRWREQVDRSVITLKLLTYAPTGALVAAATAGLPELVGGERTGTTASPGSGTAPSRCMRCWVLGSPRRPRPSSAGWATGPPSR